MLLTHSHHEVTRHCKLFQWQFIHQQQISSSIYGVLSGKQLYLTAAWTYRLALTLQQSVGVCDEIRWERTYSPAPWLIFTVKDNRQCPTAHNANFWHISANFMPDLWWHAVTSVTVHHSSHCVMLHWRWYSADNTNKTSSLCRDTVKCSSYSFLLQIYFSKKYPCYENLSMVDCNNMLSKAYYCLIAVLL